MFSSSGYIDTRCIKAKCRRNGMSKKIRFRTCSKFIYVRIYEQKFCTQLEEKRGSIFNDKILSTEQNKYVSNKALEMILCSNIRICNSKINSFVNHKEIQVYRSNLVVVISSIWWLSRCQSIQDYRVKNTWGT